MDSMLQSLLTTAIVTGGIVMGLAIIGSTVLIALKILKGSLSRKGRGAETEEVRLVQEMYRGLSRMEERVEALETILLEKRRKDEGK
jgi:phage shock protein B